jgi:hypothetical protein
MKKRTFLIAALSAVFIALSISACSDDTHQKASEDKTTVSPKPRNLVEQGKYLVAIMGCNDCHSPKRMGPNGPEIIPELMLSGYPSDRPIVKFEDKMVKDGFAMFYPDLTAGAGPWGVTFAANLTPDETGIGSWTLEQFKKALTQGKLKGMDNGRTLQPPMPWQNYVTMKDEDVEAVYMYLRSIKPVKNTAPAPITPDKM